MTVPHDKSFKQLRVGLRKGDEVSAIANELLHSLNFVDVCVVIEHRNMYGLLVFTNVHALDLFCIHALDETAGNAQACTASTDLPRHAIRA